MTKYNDPHTVTLPYVSPRRAWTSPPSPIFGRTSPDRPRNASARRRQHSDLGGTSGRCRCRRRFPVRDFEAAASGRTDAFYPDYWLPGAKSVISFFLPFSNAMKKSYERKSTLPSLEWVSGRQNGEVFLNVARRALARYLEKQGGRAIVPNLDLRYRAVNLIPNWSERMSRSSLVLGLLDSMPDCLPPRCGRSDRQCRHRSRDRAHQTPLH